MSSNKSSPFCEEDYREEGGCLGPILDILVGKNRKKILAYVDTGCSTGLYVFKDQIPDVDIGTKISDEPSPCIVADGHIIGGDEYISSIVVGEEEKIVQITVIDPETIIGTQKAEMIPLLGRNFLDHYDVLFKGKAKKLALFRC